MSRVDEQARTAPRWSLVAIEIALIWGLMWAHAGWLPPDVNEPNYLGKAKHFWQPEWCARDFFLQTADAHHVFYWTFGWLTRWWSLDTVAYVGRALTYLLLACAWWRLSWSLVPRRAAAVLSAALMLAATARLHMAGEWVVGGLEAKAPAYAFVWLALAEMVRGAWRRVWPLVGIASAWHVVVGFWTGVGAAVVWVFARLAARNEGDGPEVPSLGKMGPAILLGLLLASPSLYGMLLLNRIATADEVAQAAEIQVFTRIPHHLDPYKFFVAEETPPYLSMFGLRHVGLIALWAVLAVWGSPSAGLKRLNLFVLAMVALVAIGLGIRWLWGPSVLDDPRRAALLLRLYWFRMSDVVVPVGAALAVTHTIFSWEPSRPELARWSAALLFGLALAHFAVSIDRWVTYPYPLADAKTIGRRASVAEQRHRNWRAVCEEVRTRAPAGAVFLTPPYSQTFKWYAERAEVVTWKEMPQDARSVIEWWDRFREIYRHDGRRTVSLAHSDEEKILQLAALYGADFLLTEANPSLRLPLWYHNDSFAIYDVNRSDDDRAQQRGSP
ncbi:MAG: hypothetical protein DWQ31_13065 [Planctomycetota bacterium]|nr:MAG: hypothetical protein DWQ31_13065 [Planctomycetota bacterium]REK27017.1 MAG: hypothetical protein DWQ42_08130 [Planctomycetota bacterium]